MVACDKSGQGKNATQDAGVVDAGPAFVAHHGCEWKTAGTCTDFANAAEIEQHKKLCDGFQGSFLNGACPKERVVGTCEIQSDERKRYYQGEGALAFTAQTAKENCESAPVKGKFTAP